MSTNPVATAPKHYVRPDRRTTIVGAGAAMLMSAIQLSIPADRLPAILDKRVIGMPPGRPYSPGLEVADTPAR
jgi:hypothetical protein